MIIRGAKTIALIATAACILNSCGEAARGWDHRYGPHPIFNKEELKKSIQLQNDVLDQFYNESDKDNDSSDERSYTATLVGFNYIDEQCDLYLRELFAIDQDRVRLKKAIDSTGLLANAVLVTTSASKATMSIVTQAFGLSSQYTDTIANSYLYNVEPTTVFKIVDDMKRTYRQQTTTDKDAITSRPVVYARLRGYLQLCMPPTIASKISVALASSKAEINPENKPRALVKTTVSKSLPAAENPPDVTLMPGTKAP